MRLDGKTAVVTGGASGIGRAIAARFAEAGARIVVLDRDEERAREVCAEIGGGARFVRADLRSVAEIDAAFARILSTAGGVDVLVNCAGRFVIASLEETSGRGLGRAARRESQGHLLLHARGRRAHEGEGQRQGHQHQLGRRTQVLPER